MKVTVNGKHDFLIDGDIVNDQPNDWDLLELREGSFHILKGNRSYNATVVQYDRTSKTAVIKVNGNDYRISIRDKNDLLLEKLGMADKKVAAVNDIRAPMPGLIINIEAKDGDEIKKGDKLVILEAMKMENVIKSPYDGRVKKVHVNLKQTVEKNQLLIEFEK